MSELNVTTAVPLSWLTTASLTASSASSAFFTLASQWPHIIPSIFIVFVIDFSSLSFGLFVLFFLSGVAFLSCLGSYTLHRFSRKALVTTQKLDRLIAAAPNIGLSFHPNKGYHKPAASGIPITL